VFLKIIRAFRAAAKITRARSSPSRISGKSGMDISSMQPGDRRLEQLVLTFFAMSREMSLCEGSN
jgi:hypothetical protein